MTYHTENTHKNPGRREFDRPARSVPVGGDFSNQTSRSPDGQDAISPKFAKLALEIRQSRRSVAAGTKEIAEHLTLYQLLVSTQGRIAADETVEQMAAFYRFRRQHPEIWKEYGDEVARRNR